MRTKIVLNDGFGRNQKVKLMSIRNTSDWNIYSLIKYNLHFLDTDPSKIGNGQPEELKTKWGEAEQFGGKMHTANITVKAFYN